MTSLAVLTLLSFAIFIVQLWYMFMKHSKVIAQLPVVVKERTGFVGTYNGATIPEFIVLEDNSRFAFESLAVKLLSGIYAAREPTIRHVIIDQNLLYKLVQS